jgi:chromosome partitioning protein
MQSTKRLLQWPGDEDTDFSRNQAVRTIAITNLKGGCGKTTTSVNLAAALALKGYRTLLVDLDPQGHATLGLGIVPENQKYTIYNVIVDPRVRLERVLCRTNIPKLMVAPSNVLLSGAEAALMPMKEREYVLLDRLKGYERYFDYCIIDCSPSLSLLTLNALDAATEVIIPMQTHYYSIEGLKQVLETLDVVQNRFNPLLNIRGILLTMAEQGTVLARDVEKQMRDYFGPLVLRTVIHRNIRLAEAPAAGESIMTFDGNNLAAKEYRQLAEEICHEKIRIAQTDFVHI